jgi:hypothetical protein
MSLTQRLSTEEALPATRAIPRCPEFTRYGPIIRHYGDVFDKQSTRDPRSASSFARSRNSLSNGAVFALLYPITRSIIGTSPRRGRATTEAISESCTYVGNNVKPPVDATSDIPPDSVSVS